MFGFIPRPKEPPTPPPPADDDAREPPEVLTRAQMGRLLYARLATRLGVFHEDDDAEE